MVPDDNIENESAESVESVEIKVRNLNNGDNGSITVPVNEKKTPVEIFHSAGWTFVKENAQIMSTNKAAAITPTLSKFWLEADTLVLSNKGTSAGY